MNIAMATRLLVNQMLYHQAAELMELDNGSVFSCRERRAIL